MAKASTCNAEVQEKRQERKIKILRVLDDRDLKARWE